jgi:hypothetical protein
MDEQAEESAAESNLRSGSPELQIKSEADLPLDETELVENIDELIEHELLNIDSDPLQVNASSQRIQKSIISNPSRTLSLWKMI